MGNTQQKPTFGAVFTVVSLVVLPPLPAHGVDRQAQAREAMQAAQALMARPNNYTGAQAQAFEAQRAATARALGAASTAADGSRSNEAASGRGATASSVGALTQPVQVARQNPLPAESTAFADGQTSLLMSIAATGAQSAAYTADAGQMAEQQTKDLATAFNDNSNQMIASLMASIQTQIQAQRKAEAQAAAQAAVDRAAKAAAKKTIRDRLGVNSRRPAGAPGGDPLNQVPANVQSETQEIIGNLDKAAKDFVGRDNIAAAAARQTK